GKQLGLERIALVRKQVADLEPRRGGGSWRRRHLGLWHSGAARRATRARCFLFVEQLAFHARDRGIERGAAVGRQRLGDVEAPARRVHLDLNLRLTVILAEGDLSMMLAPGQLADL